MKTTITILLALNYLILSCSSEGLKSEQFIKKNERFRSESSDVEFYKKSGKNAKMNVVVLEGISYAFTEVSALSYIKHKGKNAQNEDLSALNKETVFMLEMKVQKEGIEFFESPLMLYSKDDAIQYLVGEILDDFKIQQNNTKFSPLGVQYEGILGQSNRIRVTFFFTGIDLNSPFTIEYYDRLFGKGLIKNTRTKNELTV